MPPHLQNEPRIADATRVDILVGDIGKIRGDVAHVKEKIEDMSDGMVELRGAMTLLVKHDLQMQHDREAVAIVRADIQDLGARVRLIEVGMPGLVEVRRWIVIGVIGILASVGAASLALVVKHSAVVSST
jgi:hypothetical protein